MFRVSWWFNLVALLVLAGVLEGLVPSGSSSTSAFSTCLDWLLKLLGCSSKTCRPYGSSVFQRRSMGMDGPGHLDHGKINPGPSEYLGGHPSAMP